MCLDLLGYSCCCTGAVVLLLLPGHGSYGSVARALDIDNGFIFAVKKSTVGPGSAAWRSGPQWMPLHGTPCSGIVG